LDPPIRILGRRRKEGGPRRGAGKRSVLSLGLPNSCLARTSPLRSRTGGIAVKLRTILASVCLAVAAAMLSPPIPALPAPTIWAYPGAAPCDTTLQACLSNAAAGDTIR